MPARLMPTLALGIFLGALDMNILALALPLMSAEFDVPAATTVWLVTAYSAAYMVAMPIAGRLGDLFGRKQAFLGGIAIFTLGSLLCAAAGWAGNWLWLLLAGRLVQGAGAGGLVPVATALIGEHVPPERRGKALGVVGMVFGLASLAGPLAGGALLEWVGWEWLFAANVPVGILALVMAIRHLPTTKPAASGPVDGVGGALLATMLGTLMVGAELFSSNVKVLYSGLHGAVPAWWGASALALVAFLLWERRRPAPMLDLGLYRLGPVRLAYALSFLYGVGMLVAMVFTPMYFHYRFGMSPMQAGLSLIPLALASGYSAMKGGKLTDRRGPRAVMALGLGLFALGLGLLAVTAASASLPVILAVLVVVGLGFGYCHTPLNHLVLKCVEPARHGQVTGALATHRSLGGILGATAGALLIAGSMSRIGTLMIEQIGGSLPPSCFLPTIIDPNHIAEMVAVMPEEVRPMLLATADRIVSEQMVLGLSQLYTAGAVTLLVGLALTWWLPRQPRALSATVPQTASEPLPASGT